MFSIFQACRSRLSSARRIWITGGPRPQPAPQRSHVGETELQQAFAHGVGLGIVVVVAVDDEHVVAVELALVVGEVLEGQADGPGDVAEAKVAVAAGIDIRPGRGSAQAQ
ncbi:MAG: hypothetical protein IIA64_10040 [Planctomycetes bacterium]|nr:hypothetical protein [Planctomycetota bacterium]